MLDTTGPRYDTGPVLAARPAVSAATTGGEAMSDLQFLDWAAGDKHPRPPGARDQRSAALPHFPLRAKAEPGNVNGVHLSSTVQATKSNYSRAHGGSSVPYLDCFREAGPGGIGC